MNYAGDADANVKDRERALFHLGQAMHTTQDFYCRSNYVELEVAAAEAKHGWMILTMPPWWSGLICRTIPAWIQDARNWTSAQTLAKAPR